MNIIFYVILSIVAIVIFTILVLIVAFTMYYTISFFLDSLKLLKILSILENNHYGYCINNY